MSQIDLITVASAAVAVFRFGCGKRGDVVNGVLAVALFWLVTAQFSHFSFEGADAGVDRNQQAERDAKHELPKPVHDENSN